MTAPTTIDEILGPKGLPLLGNMFDIDTHSPIDGFIAMAKEYGPIYKLTLPAGSRLMVSGADLVDDNVRRRDIRQEDLLQGLKALQKGVAGPGLFTSETSDPMWHRAHNILMAPFSQQAMREYMPRMLDIAGQLMGKWSRLNPDEEVNVPVDMTSLTLDTPDEAPAVRGSGQGRGRRGPGGRRRADLRSGAPPDVRRTGAG